MAGWGTMKTKQMPNNKLKGFDENDLMMGVMLSQKPGIDLIQNCDLPPPMKVFSGSDNKTVISSMNRTKPNSTVNMMSINHEDIEDEGDGKLGLLRALRLSQTRAREAEAKCAAVSKERDSLVLAFTDDSMQLFGYRQLVRLLEIQVSKLQQKQKQVCCDCDCDCGQKEKGHEAEAADSGNGSSGLTWLMALAFCFGIAGFGFALGCKYYYF